MSEMKPRSMRMSDENYAKLQTLSENRSLDETVTFLLQIYEKDEERNALGTQSVKLDELDELLRVIRSNYATILQTATQAKEVARSEFRDQLAQKEELLNKQQGEIVVLQKQLLTQEEEEKKQSQSLQNELASCKQVLEMTKKNLEDSQKVITQKQQTLEALTKALSVAEQKASQVEPLKEQLEELQKKEKEYTYFSNELVKARAEIEKLTLQKEQVERDSKETLEKEQKNLTTLYQLEIEKVKSEAELSIREAKLIAATQVNEIREKYQEKMFELLEKEKRVLQNKIQASP
jgi:hypothetical protein